MQKDAVADKRRHPFFTIDNAVILEYGPKIGSNALALYVILACHAKETSGTCYPSIKRLMVQMQRSREVVYQAIETLKEHGLISVEGRRDPDSDSLKSNLYTLLPISHPSTLSELGSSHTELGDALSELPLVHIADDPSPHSELALVRYPNRNKTNIEQDEENKTNLNKKGCDAASASQTKKPAKPAASGVWEAYREAYSRRYGTDPVRNAKVNAQLSQLVSRVGLEPAIGIAAWFLTHRGGWYCQQKHSVGCLLQDCEKLHTEWRTSDRASPLEPDDGKLAIVRHAEANVASVVAMRAKMNLPPNP